MITTFESIRGIAALIVALYHLDIGSDYFPIIRNGYLFVDLFFVLSGFIMCSAYESRLDTIDNVRSFAIRRIGRLYPLFLFSTLAFLLNANFLVLAKQIASSLGYASLLNNPGALEYVVPTMAEVLATLTLSHSMGIFDHLILNTPTWSISVEFYTYFLFAALCFIVSGKTRLIAFMVLSFFGLAASVWASTTFHNCLEAKGCLSLTYDFGFARCVHAFFLGALAFHAKGVIKVNSTALQVAAISTLGLLLVLVDQFPAIAFAFPMAFTVLILAIGNDTGPAYLILKPKIFQLLGERSYSIYLMHMPLLLFFENIAKRVTGLIPNAMVLLLFVVTLIVISGWTYKFIENPFRSMFNRIADRGVKLKARPTN